MQHDVFDHQVIPRSGPFRIVSLLRFRKYGSTKLSELQQAGDKTNDRNWLHQAEIDKMALTANLCSVMAQLLTVILSIELEEHRRFFERAILAATMRVAL